MLSLTEEDAGAGREHHREPYGGRCHHGWIHGLPLDNVTSCAPNCNDDVLFRIYTGKGVAVFVVSLLRSS